VDIALCDAANSAFDAEVYPPQAHIYRQTTARAERNQFSETGFVLNPLLNVQSVDPRLFPEFRNKSVEVLTAPAIQAACPVLFGEPGKIVQSMYFHGNPSTWPHRDTYYRDSSNKGTMTAARIAAEDIEPGAGRFFVCPGSHRLDMEKNGGDFDIAYHHDRYKKLAMDAMRGHQTRVAAPALKKGDALFGSVSTIHGSLSTSQPDRSRRSFTIHWIPASTELPQFQTRARPMAYDTVNGALVARPKDLSRARNRTILGAESRFPGTYSFAKKVAIKLLVR
jgi:phytanoyl-CoA hydroxylase